MATKKIQIEYDINGKAIDVAIDKTLNLQQQAKALTAELRRTSDPEAFKLLSNRLGDVNDGLAQTNAKSKDLFSSLSMLPGPVGDFFGQLSGSVDLLKTFSSFSLKDISFQLGETASDIGDIGKNLVGLNEVQEANVAVTETQAAATAELATAEAVATTSTEAHVVSLEAETVATEAAEVATIGLGTALKAIGIGLLIAGIAALVVYWDDLKKAIFGTTEEEKRFNAVQQKAAENGAEQISVLTNIGKLLKSGKVDQYQKNEAVNQYNKTLGDTLGKVKSWGELEDKLKGKLPDYIHYLDLKAQAEAAYQLSLEVTKEKIKLAALPPEEAVSGWKQFFLGLQSIQYTGTWSKGIVLEGEALIKEKTNKLEKDYLAYFGKYTDLKALQDEAAKNLKIGPEAITYTGDTKSGATEDPKVKARKAAIEELKKLDEEAYKATLTTREKEEYEINKKYADALYLATKYGQDTTTLKAGQEAELLAMAKKFAKEDDAIKKERLEKEKEFWKKAKEAADEKRKKEAEIKRDIALTDLQAEINALDKKNALLDYDFEQDLARLEEKRKKVDEAEKIELANTELNEAEKNKVKQKYADQRAAIDEQEVATTKAKEESKYNIALAAAEAFQRLGSFLQQIAEGNKDLAITGIIIEKAAALASIAINAKKNFTKDGGISSPLAWLNLAAAGVSAGAVVFAAIKGVNDIKNAGKGSSASGSAPDTNPATANLVKGYADGGMIGGRRHAQGGTLIEAEQGEAIMTRGAVSQFAPLLSLMNQAGGGTSFNPGVTGGAHYDNPKSATSSDQPVFKTYVVSSELTSHAEKQAKLKDLSTL